MAHLPIWIRDETGTHTLEPTLPNCWQGEADCIVGPFSSKTVAEYFVSASTIYCRYDTLLEPAFAKGDAWYIKVKALNA